jgi:putative transcriptional regulator
MVAESSTSLVGKLLIAMPNLVDPNFWRSVVLLGVHSSDEGAFGLVINRPLDVDLRDILRELGDDIDSASLPAVLSGGPVQPEHGFVLFQTDEPPTDENAILVAPDVKVSGSTEILSALAHGTLKGRYNLFLGYSGWYPGQLEREIEENSWLVAPLDSAILFDVPLEDRWSAALNSIGVEPGTLVDTGSSTPT